MGRLDIDSTTGLTISSAALPLGRASQRQRHDDPATRPSAAPHSNRTYDQLIFVPDTSHDVTDPQQRRLPGRIADDSGGHGLRLPLLRHPRTSFRFTGNRVHDIAADGLQGLNGTNVTDRPQQHRTRRGQPRRSSRALRHDPDRRQRCWDEDHQQLAPRPGLLANGRLAAASATPATSTSTAAPTELAASRTTCSTHDSRGRTEICGLGTGGTHPQQHHDPSQHLVDLGLGLQQLPRLRVGLRLPAAGNTVTDNIAVDPDGGLRSGRLAYQRPPLGRTTSGASPASVTLDANGNCTSANCNPTSSPIGYRKPSGVSW